MSNNSDNNAYTLRYNCLELATKTTLASEDVKQQKILKNAYDYYKFINKEFTDLNLTGDKPTLPKSKQEEYNELLNFVTDLEIGNNTTYNLFKRHEIKSVFKYLIKNDLAQLDCYRQFGSSTIGIIYAIFKAITSKVKINIVCYDTLSISTIVEDIIGNINEDIIIGRTSAKIVLNNGSIIYFNSVRHKLNITKLGDSDIIIYDIMANLLPDKCPQGKQQTILLNSGGFGYDKSPLNIDKIDIFELPLSGNNGDIDHIKQSYGMNNDQIYKSYGVKVDFNQQF